MKKESDYTLNWFKTNLNQQGVKTITKSSYSSHLPPGSSTHTCCFSHRSLFDLGAPRLSFLSVHSSFPHPQPSHQSISTPSQINVPHVCSLITACYTYNHVIVLNLLSSLQSLPCSMTVSLCWAALSAANAAKEDLLPGSKLCFVLAALASVNGALTLLESENQVSRTLD